MESEPKLDPSTITDMETAKLALRWAVEKIHTMQEELGRLREECARWDLAGAEQQIGGEVLAVVS
jgi:hypothetical protein